MRSRLAQALLLAVAIAVAVAIGELSLRHVFHSVPQLELDIYRMQDGLLLLRPNLERRHVTPHWDVQIRTNSAGWRDGEPAAGRRTVLGLGDSFAFGWGVELDESFFTLVEKGISGRERIEVIQAAVPGSSTLDQERLLDDLVERYRPEAVVLALFVGNDFTETGLGGVERLRVADGLIELKPLGPEPPGLSGRIRRWLARHSRILQLLRAVQFQQGLAGDVGVGTPRTWDEWMREFAQIHLRRPTPRAQESIRATLASLDRIAARCDEDGIELVVFVIPRSFQIDARERQEMQTQLGVTTDDVDMDQPQRLLATWANRAGVVLVDPLDDFRRRHGAGEQLYFSPDAHLTPAGHAALADALLPELASLMAVNQGVNLEGL